MQRYGYDFGNPQHNNFQIIGGNQAQGQFGQQGVNQSAYYQQGYSQPNYYQSQGINLSHGYNQQSFGNPNVGNFGQMQGINLSPNSNSFNMQNQYHMQQNFNPSYGQPQNINLSSGYNQIGSYQVGFP